MTNFPSVIIYIKIFFYYTDRSSVDNYQLFISINASLNVSSVHLPTLLLIIPINLFVSIIINITDRALYPSVMFNFPFFDVLITNGSCPSVIPSIKLLLADFLDFSVDNSVSFLCIFSSVSKQIRPKDFFFLKSIFN